MGLILFLVNSLKTTSNLALASGCQRLSKPSHLRRLPDPQPSSMPRYFPRSASISFACTCLSHLQHMTHRTTIPASLNHQARTARPPGTYIIPSAQLIRLILRALLNVAPQTLKLPQERIEAELLTKCLVSSRMVSKPRDPSPNPWIASDGSPLRGYYWTRIDPKVQPNYWV